MNDEITRLRWSAAFNEYVCECGQRTCVIPISLSIEEFDEIRGSPGRFVVHLAHWSPRYERVVRETERYQVIEETDPDDGVTASR